MLDKRKKIGIDDARQIWAALAAEGKAPPELTFASQVLPVYSVGIDKWIERLASTYFRGLCRQHAHFKMVIAPYGGGKTHFLMTLGSKALDEGYAVSYIACTQGADLNNSFDIYRHFIQSFQLPGQDRPGLRRFLSTVVERKLTQIEEAGAPDEDIAFSRWLDNVSRDDHQENAFGRVIAEALRAERDPTQAVAGDAPLRWLRGEIDTLTKEELAALRLSKIPVKARNELGRNLIISIAKFVHEAGALGVVMLFDEAETMFNATGKALLRVLSAMRVMVDIPSAIPGGVPLFGVFSAVPDILENFTKYKALEQRMAVKGVPFEEGSDFAPQIHLEKIDTQESLLRMIGDRLVALGRLATGCEFDDAIQAANIETLTRVAAERNLEIDARRLFVKSWINILDIQTKQGERIFSEDELSHRYAGFFQGLKESEKQEYEP